MVTMDKVKRGMAAYLETELIPSLGGWQKWLVGAGAAILVNRMDNVMANMANMPIVKMMDIIHGDNIDIETVYEAVREQAKTTPAVIDVPGVGTFKLGAADVDKLYRMIMEA